MTLKEFIDNILIDIDEDYSDSLLINKVRKYVNRGYIELAKRQKLRKSSNVTFTNGRAKIPTNCITPYLLSIDDINVRYKVDGKYLVVDGYTGIGKLIYSFVPEPLEGDDDVPLTKACDDEFIILYSKYLFFLSTAEYEVSKMYKIEFESYKVNVERGNIIKIIDVYGGNEDV